MIYHVTCACILSKINENERKKEKGGFAFLLIGATKGQRKKGENLQGLSSI